MSPGVGVLKASETVYQQSLKGSTWSSQPLKGAPGLLGLREECGFYKTAEDSNM